MQYLGYEIKVGKMISRRRKRGGEASASASAVGCRNINGLNGLEDNTLAMLEFSSNTLSQDYIDDRLTFLEAVRSASLIPDNGVPPTKKMYEAIFGILKDESSLELIMASYQLLHDLKKCFPKVCFPELANASSNSLDVMGVDEAWSPFYFGRLEEEMTTTSSLLIDPFAFHSLIEEVAQVSCRSKAGVLELQSIRAMLLLQYLLVVIEADFLPRTNIFQECMNWALLRNSTTIDMFILGSRKIIHKALIKDCLQLMSEMFAQESEIHENVEENESSAHLVEGYDPAFSLAFPEVQMSSRASLMKLFCMMMELDSFRCVADQHGLTSREDCVRTPAADIILDELIYKPYLLTPFLQIFDKDNMLLKLIMQYFQKYIPKSSVRTRRSNGSVDNTTFDAILKCLSNSTTAKSIIKKIGINVVQLLVAHAFKAYLSLSLDQPAEGLPDAAANVKDTSLIEVCKLTISAITCIREVDKDARLVLILEEALFTAATIISFNQ
ncbi:hypothetical protein Leryth_026706 [Lithospermum erythrorhizon]|nr:hypothetical protein Leryth_026706 [Lithospermum erythrorhizon]